MGSRRELAGDRRPRGSQEDEGLGKLRAVGKLEGDNGSWPELGEIQGRYGEL